MIWQVLFVPSTVKNTECVHKEFVSDKIYQYDNSAG
jgi:hypothetical protein